MIRFRKISVTRIFAAAALVVLFLSGPMAYSQDGPNVTGEWRGEFSIRDGRKAPFQFEVQDNGNVYLLNGPERFETGKITVKDDSVFVPLDQFDNELALKLVGNTLTGVLRKQDHTGVPIPVSATKGKSDRFPTKNPPAKDITGNYSLVFAFESGKKEEAVGIFKQEGKVLTGTFLKPSGDTRFLEGVVDGNRFYLSSFIGSSPGYYEGTFTTDGRMEGVQLGTKVKHHFTGRLDGKAKMKDPYAVSTIKKGERSVSFSLPDMDGNMVSLTDDKYKGKVVILAITGTWCPNCIDEAAFLSPWYKANRNRGVEIITIHFERQTDTAFTNKVMSRFRKRFDIQYDQVFGGLPQAEHVKKAIAGIDSFSSFPTTIFVDKRGNVSKIHSGYTGPATGKFYDEFVKEFNEEVDRLLAQ